MKARKTPHSSVFFNLSKSEHDYTALKLHRRKEARKTPQSRKVAH
jgi:hypothetical protein